jgi:hypothetical protein
MCVGSPIAGTWFSSQWRPDDEFETDSLDHVIVLNQTDLRRTIVRYVFDYQGSRTHLVGCSGRLA